LITGVATDERETMVAYAVSPRQCGKIGHTCWKKHLDSLKKAEMVKPNEKRSPTKKPVIFNIYNCYGKRKDPLSCKVSDCAYKSRTSEQTMNECNSGLSGLLSDTEYLTSRGLWSLLSSDQLKHVQDTYQLTTSFTVQRIMQQPRLLQSVVIIDQLYMLMMTIITQPCHVFLRK
jgi:hypothetical protein